MNDYISAKRTSLALLLVGFGLLGTPATAQLRAMEILSPEADAVTTLADRDLAELSEEDAAYVRAMKEHLDIA